MNELHYQLNLLKAMNEKLSDRERVYRLICDTSDAAYLYYSFEKRELFVFGKWEQFFMIPSKELRDLSAVADEVEESYAISLRDVLFLEKTGEEERTIDCLHKNGKSWIQFKCKVIYDNGNPVEKIISVHNITKQKYQNEELLYMAYYDGLTGLYNRNYFMRLLTEYVNRAAEEHCVVSVMVIDIDDFRNINDSLGIIVGDELVQQFGTFLKEFSADNVIVGHISSDVFSMAIYNPAGETSVEQIHKKMQQRFEKPFQLLGGHSVSVTASIGVAEYPEATDSAFELINCAEIVMFKGKAMGKNRIQYFDAPILNDFLSTVEIENKLKEATYKKNFMLYFQPQYYAGNRRMRGVEALIRWRDETGQMISPAVFIPIAEKNGAILSIGKWVVEQSICNYARLKALMGTRFILSINISALQYKSADFVSNLLENIQKYKVDPEDIELEITESVLIDDFDAVIEKIQVLRQHGIRISLDDFGTGFSSLLYLKNLPIDTLKIDKSFIDTVLTDSSTRVITESVVNMAKTLGFETVAEGVEKEQQYKYLHSIGCNIIQGYYFSKPLPLEELEKLFQ